MSTRITIEVTLKRDAGRDDIGERLFVFLANDPFDMFPEVDTVDGWTVVDDE